MTDTQKTDPMANVYAYSQREGIPIADEWHIEARQKAELAGQAKAQQLAALEVKKGRIAAIVEHFNRLYPKFLKSLRDCKM